MSLEQTLRTVIGRLNSGSLDNEAQVKSAVVLPVLRELGWDDADPDAFKPEYAVDRRFVDYALLDHGKPLVFIEAKHAGAKVGKGEEQLFGYASNKGVPLLALTNGWFWDFYLSMAEGPPTDRRFYSLDLHRGDKISEYVAFLDQHLRKVRVVSGGARLSAEELLSNNRQRQRAREMIPEAWRALVKERDEILRDLLAERVESKCGAKPDFSDVDAFLTSLRALEQAKGLMPSPPDSPKGPLPTALVSKKKAKIKGFVFRGQRKECKTAIGTLAEVLNVFQREDSEFMNRFAPKTIRPKRRLVARNQAELYKDARFASKSRDLENGWWLGTNYGSDTIRKFLKTACDEAGIKLGDQLELIEE